MFYAFHPIIVLNMQQTTMPIFIGEEAEHSNMEFKSCSGGRIPNDLWKTISAFANSEGGKIICGVDPAGKSLSLSKAEIDRLQLDISSLCSQSFSSTITPEIQYSNGVLIVYIPPSPAQLRPVFSKKHGSGQGTYVREGSANRTANDEMIRRFSIAARGGAETIEYTDQEYLECFDMTLVDEYISLLNKKKSNMYQRFSTEEVLLKLRAINKQGNPTLFGLLAFGGEAAPQEIIAPTVNIVVTQYPGVTKVNEADLSETYIDNREFTGNAKAQFDAAFLFLKSKLPIRGTIDSSGKRRDYLVIPEVAIRESLANAIAHRDYSTYSSPIQIDIFSDRVEIINPGASLVPIEQLDEAPSTARNPLLMGYLKEYGITDQKARGIRTIKVSLREAGLEAPGFENIGQSFKTTLSASAFISHDDKKWLQKFATFTLNERQLNALAHVRNNPEGISNGEYRDINSMHNVRDDKKANKELKQLVEKRILSTLGENKARRYILRGEHV